RTRRQLDLDLGFEQGCPAQLRVGRQLFRRHVERMIEGIAESKRRIRSVSARGEHEREAGIGIPTALVSSQERGLGSREITAAQPDPTELAQRPAKLALQIRTKLIARAQRFLFRFAGLPAQPKNLCPVDAAAPAEAADCRSLGPTLHRCGPLL